MWRVVLVRIATKVKSIMMGIVDKGSSSSSLPPPDEFNLDASETCNTD